MHDGSKETILEQLERGDTFPNAREKVWTHIKNELEFCYKDYLDSDSSDANDDKPSKNIDFEFLPHGGSSLLSEIANNQRKDAPSKSENATIADTASGSKGLTMLERQELWLSQKQKKIDAYNKATKLADEALKFIPDLRQSQSSFSRKLTKGSNRVARCTTGSVSSNTTATRSTSRKKTRTTKSSVGGGSSSKQSTKKKATKKSPKKEASKKSSTL